MIRFRKHAEISEELRASLNAAYDTLLAEVNASLKYALLPPERAGQAADSVSGQTRRDEVAQQVKDVVYADDE